MILYLLAGAAGVATFMLLVWFLRPELVGDVGDETAETSAGGVTGAADGSPAVVESLSMELDSPSTFRTSHRNHTRAANRVALARNDYDSLRFDMAVRGYDPDAVDAFIADYVKKYGGECGESCDVRAGVDGEKVSIPVRRWGYRMDQVDPVITALIRSSQ